MFKKKLFVRNQRFQNIVNHLTIDMKINDRNQGKNAQDCFIFILLLDTRRDTGSDFVFVCVGAIVNHRVLLLYSHTHAHTEVPV